MMRITELYDMLCKLYGIKARLAIEHFLVLAERPSGIAVGNGASEREALIIRQTGDDIELGLFIDPGVLAAIESGDALDHIDELSCAAEGVSHFLYVSDRAGKERSVSRLEIELQGEVDKFLLIHLIAEARSPAVPPWLFSRQFEDFRFDGRLTPEEIERYATASHFAAKYCASLREGCFNPLRYAKLREHANDFFERDLAAKLARLIP